MILLSSVKNFKRKRGGFIAIVGLLLVLGMGSLYVGSLLNARWVDNSKASIIYNENLLNENNYVTMSEYNKNSSVYAAHIDKSLAWWMFLSKNLASLSDVITFKQSVKNMYKQSKSYLNEEVPVHLSASGINLQEGRVYKSFMQRYDDLGNGYTWLFPIIKKIPDMDIKSGSREKEDSIAVALLDSGYIRKYYPSNILTGESQFSVYYSSRGTNSAIKMQSPF